MESKLQLNANSKTAQFIKDNLSATDVVEVIIGLGKAITASEMAEILKNLFDLTETGQALYCIYPNLGAGEMIAILKSAYEFSGPGRTKMIETLENIGYDVFETLNAVNPIYPEIVVIKYDKGNAKLTAKPTVDSSNVKVFFYENTRNPKKWNWNLLSSKVEKIYSSKDVSVVAHSKYKKYGLFKIGSHRNWDYTKSLFPNYRDLQLQILSLLAFAINDSYLPFPSPPFNRKDYPIMPLLASDSKEWFQQVFDTPNEPNGVCRGSFKRNNQYIKSTDDNGSGYLSVVGSFPIEPREFYSYICVGGPGASTVDIAILPGQNGNQEYQGWNGEQFVDEPAIEVNQVYWYRLKMNLSEPFPGSTSKMVFFAKTYRAKQGEGKEFWLWAYKERDNCSSSSFT
ncbi:MAG: hypothetical protein JKY54_07345 [Flavobacteriales bacterium]|nr:hypothetical protein [Flavobacteriales bacterium]